jgi:hypothetical protein
MRHERTWQGDKTGLPALQSLAVIAVALALVPTGAHVFELPNKLGLAPQDYLTVQKIYRGWDLFGFVIAVSLLASGAHAYFVRANSDSLRWSLVAIAGIMCTQLLFWTLIFPLNELTQNWTVLPSDFESARHQWEYAQAACFALNLMSLAAIIFAVQSSRPLFSVGIMDALAENFRVRAARARALALHSEHSHDDVRLRRPS